MKSLLLSCALGIFFLAGCENAFIREVEMEGFPAEPLPLVWAFLNPADTLIQVRITHAEPAVGEVPDGQSSSDPMEGAQVWLEGPDGEVALSYSKQLGTYVIQAEDFAVLPGNWYSLRVITALGQQATASCYVPASQIDRESVVVEYSQTNDGKEASIGFRDLAAEENYYYLHKYTFNFADNPPYLNDDVGYFPLTDKGQDGNMLFTESFELHYDYGGQSSTVYVLYQVDENFYRYHVSLKELRRNIDNEFAEPFNLYTNVEGGLGIFAAMNPQLRFRIE